MKKVIVGFFMMLILSSFVLAVGSEININFVVDVQHKQEVSNYVSDRSFVEDYLWNIVLVFVVLVFVYLVFNNKISSKKKKVSNKKVSKKKVSKGANQKK